MVRHTTIHNLDMTQYDIKHDTTQNKNTARHDCEEKCSFTTYSNLYMYNYKEYDYTLLRHIYHD
jgi:hypothetical protein